jgi:hypothetical protein
MKLKTCSCGKENTTKNAVFTGPQYYSSPIKKSKRLLLFTCSQCKTTFAIGKLKSEKK